MIVEEPNGGSQPILVGWAVQLLGDAIDLRLWLEHFPLHFDPFVIRLDHRDGEYVLKSTAFDNAATPGEVREHATTLISQLNGTMNAVASAEPLAVGPILNFLPNGSIERRWYVQPVSLRSRQSATSPTIKSFDCNGKEVPQPRARMSAAQTWTNLAQEDEQLADLLAHFGRSSGDWFEIYKTIEVAKALGKKLGGYDRLLGDGAKRAEEIRRVANAKRHWRVSYKPSDDVTMAEAVAFARDLVSKLMIAAQAKRDSNA